MLDEQISRLLKWGGGLATGLCLVAAVVASKLDAHWALQALFWFAALAGICIASWRKPMPDIRDTSARAAQPGLYEGSQHNAGGSGGD